jgi:group I intron endonuclease
MNNMGIYKIVNLINNKIYVGSSNNFNNRKYNHFSYLRNNRHYNKHLQQSFNKYGSDNFIFETIEYVKDESKLLEREQYWIDKLDVCNPEVGYNNDIVAGKPPSFLGKKHSEETRNKISKTRKKIMTNELKDRIRNTLIGKPHSLKRKENISNGRKNKGGKVVINLTTNTIFNSINEAGKHYNLNSSCISRVCRNVHGHKTAGGYRWEYYKENSSD